MKMQIYLSFINIFLIRLLTGKTITSESDAMKCMEMLHQMGSKTVVISSSSIGPAEDLIAFGSTKSIFI
jgi:pyridoxine kinase